MSTRQLFTAAAVFCWISLAANTAVAQDPLEDVRRLMEAGNSSDALTAVEAALAADSDRVEAMFLRGVLLFEDGRVEPARRAFEGLIEDFPDYPEAYNNLAVIQAATGDYDGATETLKRSLGTDASYQAAYENLTRIFAQLASEAYGRALEIESPERRHVDLVFLSALSSPPLAPEVVSEPIAEPQVASVPEDVPVEEPTTGEIVASGPIAEGPPEEPPAEPAQVVEVSDLPAMEEDPEVAEDQGGPAGDVGRIVAAWARAWSEQRADDYLSFYAEGFTPGDGVSYDEWVALRRDRITGPEYIRVDVAILDSAVIGGNRATVTFMQAYESDRFSDQVTKTLELERRGEEWKIVREKAEP